MYNTAVRVWISEIKFSDDSIIPINKNDIVVIVGPNNAGKSASLKEVTELLNNKNYNGKVIKDITIEKIGDETQLISFIQSISRKIIEKSDPSPYYEGFLFRVNEQNARDNWNNYKKGISDLANIFANNLTTGTRIKMSDPPNNINLISEEPQHPIHILQKNDSIEKKISTYFNKAFGTDLIVHRNAGNNVPLYVGRNPVIKDGEDRVSEGYLRNLEKLDLLQRQGDGMRSFAGIILYAFLSNCSVLLIDEPEAFLHPHQAKLLGKMLVKDLPKERQLFLATHSEDFLKGLLETNSDNLKIIRIQRNGNINNISILDSSDINEIWSDSLLRYSNILNGLFHTKVVICEGDSDCRFYNAILFALNEDSDIVSSDVLFVHCGGNDRIPTVIKALVKLNVPLRVVSDFDVLNKIDLLKKIFEELGGVWTDVENDCILVKSAIDQIKPDLETEDAKKEIEKVFQSTTERFFPEDKISEIRAILKKTSSWRQAKKVGRAFIPSGEPIEAFERIQLKFKKKGFFILEVGELESFDRRVGNHGPKWVNDVLKKDIKNDSGLENARQFVSQLM